METKKLDEVDMELQSARGSAREPLDIPDDSGMDVIIRGIGAYYGGHKTDFTTGETIEERIRNIAIVVLDPKDPDPVNEMIYSVASETVMAKNIVNTFGNGDIGNPELNKDFLNHKVFIGKKMVELENGRSYSALVWFDHDVVSGLPDEPATIGTRDSNVDSVDDIVDDVEV